MKRKNFVILLFALAVFLLAFLLSGNRGGDVSRVSREVGPSIKFTTAEIESAMDVAQEHFEAEFQGCKLLNLTYEESYSDQFSGEWAQQYDAEEAIILLSSFTVNASGGDGSFTPNGTYGNWQWILTRDAGTDWTLQTWGYG